MLSDNVRRGLCINCKNATDCTYPRGHDGPIMQCEEFVLDQFLPEHNANESGRKGSQEEPT